MKRVSLCVVGILVLSSGALGRPAAVPPLKVVTEIASVGKDGSKSTHLVVTTVPAGHGSTPSTYTLDLPGEIDNSPYSHEHDAIIAGPGQTLLAINYRPNQSSQGLQIVLLQSTPSGIRVIRDFAQQVASLLKTPRAALMIDRMTSTFRDEPPYKISKSDLAAWSKTVDNGLGRELRVDSIGVGEYGKKAAANQIDIRAQSNEVNDAFATVTIDGQGRLKLIAFWHEAE